jgi:hypothetical protein
MRTSWLVLGCVIGVISLVVLAALVDELAGCIGCGLAAALALWWPLRGRDADVRRQPQRSTLSRETSDLLVLIGRPDRV